MLKHLWIVVLASLALHAQSTLAAPVISLTAPAANAQYPSPANVTLTATASSSGATISKIDFYRGSTLIGTATSSPYSISWNNVAAGSYSLTAKATDSKNSTKTSSAVNITVNSLPSVSLTSPVTGSSIAGPATIALAASAADSDGTISKVDFYRGSTLIGTDTSAPYTYNWTNVAVGNYTITAKATDNLGGVTTSAAAAITVKANTAPTVSVTSPVNNASYVGPATVPLSATATDTDGTISKVAFYNGSTLIGTDTSAPYTFNWANVAVGSYTVTAKATDNLGVVTTSTGIKITVSANKAPTVSLTSPTASQSIVGPTTIQLAATSADIDGTIAKVAFYNGSTLIGTTTSSPYTVSWANVAAGSYTLTAKATDNLGAITTSASVTITVKANKAPTVAISSPANNANYVGPVTIPLTATATDTDGTISKVDFYQGATLIGTATGSPYTVNWSNAPAGSYTITAKATDNNGIVTTSSAIAITIKADTAPIISLTAPANNASYTGPAMIQLAATATDTDGTVAKVDFYNGATLIGTAISSPYTANWSNVAPGNYQLTAVATDNNGTTKTSSAIAINVNAPPTVAISSPASNTNYIAPVTIPLTATSTDIDGTIAKVEFYQGAILIGTATAAPYSYNWANVPSGNYTITAKATDNQGATTTSSTITVTVEVDIPPTVSLTATPTNATAPAAISLSAMAADADGSVTKVEFYKGTILLGTVTNAPYTISWNNVSAGTYTVTAKATDNQGVTTTSSPVTVTIAAGVAQAYYIDTDHLGTPRSISDGSNIVWQWDNNDAFGNNVPNADPGNTGTPFVFNLRLPGQYFDQETNLHYNYYRDYDPQTGRYVQSDPIGLDGGINTYAYVNANPVSNIDPNGLVKWTGTSLSGGVSVGIIGYSREVYRLTSECINGLKYQVSVVAESSLTNGGISVGVSASYTGSSGNEFEDGSTIPDPNVFNGSYFKWAAGIAGGPGASFGATKLGGAYSSASLGAQYGYEMGIGLATGTSKLQWAKKLECECK